MQSNLCKILEGLILILVLTGCSQLRQVSLKSSLKKTVKKSEVVSRYFVGISLYDPENQEFLININGDKYFTPASNTKIPTLAAWLSTKNDSIPSFLYAQQGRNLRIRPLGDPTLLHPDFPLQKSIQQLMALNPDTLFIDWPEVLPTPFGSGWAWDDYQFAYQPERSLMPLYGNTMHIYTSGSQYRVIPDFFENYVELNGAPSGRNLEYNFFQVQTSPRDSVPKETQIPFKMTEELMVRLLQDTLGVPVIIDRNSTKTGTMQTMYSYHRLPVLAAMMLNSDNFLAEQLLINAQLSEEVFDQTAFLQHIESTLFTEIPHPLEWVDGSGLSRYNMFTPMSLVKILEVIYKQLSWQEINLIFPKGGVSGTLKNWYAAETPYIFAKTGTLRHNHCLSGYIVTKSGRRLIFSIMNNHYTNGSTEIKQEMQKMLESIRDAY